MRTASIYPSPWPGKSVGARIPYSTLMLDADIAIDERFDEIDIGDAGLVGISAMTGYQIHNGLQIAQQIKLKNPHVKIVWGGHHASSLPEQTLQNPLVDFVIRGPGRDAFHELARTLELKGNLEMVRGLSYKKRGSVYHIPNRPILPQDWTIPFDKIDIRRYVEDGHATIITSMGCPNACGFCSVNTMYKRHVLYRDMNVVAKEITGLIKLGAKHLIVDDDNLFVSRNQVFELAYALHGTDVTWSAGMSVDLIGNYSVEDFRYLNKTGCTEIYIGAESGSDEALRLICKRGTVKDTYDFVTKMRESGIAPKVSSMVGVPGIDDVESTFNMLEKCRDIDPRFTYVLFYYTPYVGTALYRTAIKHGFTPPDSLEGWAQHSLRKHTTPWVTKKTRKKVRFFSYYWYPYGKIRKFTVLARLHILKLTVKSWWKRLMGDFDKFGEYR